MPEIREVSKNEDVWAEGWNQPFRTVAPESIIQGIQLDKRYGDIAVTVTAEPEPENVKHLKKGPPLVTSQVSLVVDLSFVSGKDYSVHAQTPGKDGKGTITLRGVSKRSQNGNVQSFSAWEEAIGKTEDGKTKYSHIQRPIALTAVELQNTKIIIGRTIDQFQNQGKGA